MLKKEIWSEIRYCLVFNGVKLKMIKSLNAGFLTLSTLEKQIYSPLPAFCSIENQTDLDTFFVISVDALCSMFFC